MLVVFPPKFVADTKIIYGYHFVAPLKISISSDQLSNWKNRSKHFCGSPWYPIFKKQILRCIWHSPNSGFNVCSSVGLSSLTRLRVGLWNIGFVIFFGIHSTLYAIRGKTPKPLSTSFSFTKILRMEGRPSCRTRSWLWSSHFEWKLFNSDTRLLNSEIDYILLTKPFDNPLVLQYSVTGELPPRRIPPNKIHPGITVGGNLLGCNFPCIIVLILRL